MVALTLIAVIAAAVAACVAVFFALKAKSTTEHSENHETELAAARENVAALQAAAGEEARRTAEADTRLQDCLL